MVSLAFSLSPFSHLVYKCLCVALRNSAVPYNTSQLWFPSHLLAASNSSPISVSAYFNKFAVFVRTYSVRIVNSVRSHVPSFLPSYSDRVQVRVSFHSLSQFYGSWNPGAPVSVVFVFVCLCRDTAAHQQSATHESLYFDKSSFIPEVEYLDPSAIDPVCSPLSLSQLQFFTFPLVDRPPHRDTFSSSSECHATSPSTINRAYTREPRLSWSILRIDTSVVTVLPNFALDHKFINEKNYHFGFGNEQDVPLYVRHVTSESTGKHTCVMVRGLNTSAGRKLEWLHEFVRGKFVFVLSYSYQASTVELWMQFCDLYCNMFVI